MLIREELPGRVKHVPDLLHEQAPDAQHHAEWGVSVIETIQQHLSKFEIDIKRSYQSTLTIKLHLGNLSLLHPSQQPEALAFTL